MSEDGHRPVEEIEEDLTSAQWQREDLESIIDDLEQELMEAEDAQEEHRDD